MERGCNRLYIARERLVDGEWRALVKAEVRRNGRIFGEHSYGWHRSVDVTDDGVTVRPGVTLASDPTNGTSVIR